MNKKQTFPTWFWIFLSAVLITTVAGMSVLYLTGISQSPGFLALLGSIITAFGAGIGSIIKSMIGYKDQINDQTSYLEDAIEDIQENSKKELSKTQESLLIKQLDFNQKTTEFLIDSFIKIEESMNQIGNDIKMTKTELTSDINTVKKDLSKIKVDLDKVEKIKTKQDGWKEGINKDWEGCKKRIECIDKKILFSAATICKENFIDYFNQIIEMDLSPSDISSKEILIKNINDKLDICILNCNLQLEQLLTGKDDKLLKHFSESKIKLIFEYKTNLEKCFNENIINNIYKNFYNYSSIYFNEMLNQLVRSYFAANGIDD